MQNLFRVNKNRLEKNLGLLFLSKHADCKPATALTNFNNMFHFYIPSGFQGQCPFSRQFPISTPPENLWFRNV